LPPPSHEYSSRDISPFFTDVFKFRLEQELDVRSPFGTRFITLTYTLGPASKINYVFHLPCLPRMPFLYPAFRETKEAGPSSSEVTRLYVSSGGERYSVISGRSK
jgi:hypothetical protein